MGFNLKEIFQKKLPPRVLEECPACGYQLVNKKPRKRVPISVSNTEVAALEIDRQREMEERRAEHELPGPIHKNGSY